MRHDGGLRARRRAAPWGLCLLALACLAALPAVAPAPAGAQDAPTVAIDATSLEWGQTTTARGTGWAPGIDVQLVLYPDAVLLATTKAAGDGSFSTEIRVPEDLRTSAYQVTAQGLSAAGEGAAVSVTVTIRGPDASFTVDDTDLGWGDTTAVHGRSFRPGSSVKVHLAPGYQTLTEVTVGGDGAFDADVTIPSGLASSLNYGIVAIGTGADGLYKFVSVTVTVIGPRPAVSVDDDQLAWDEPVTVRGSLFEPRSEVVIVLAPNQIELGRATVGADGTFEAGVRTPSEIATSDYAVTAIGLGDDGQFANPSVPVKVLGPVAFIAVTPRAAERGATVQVAGERWRSVGVVTLTLFPGFEALGTVTVGRDGTFARDVRIPTDAQGTSGHLIMATGIGANRLFALANAGLRIGGAPPGPTGNEDAFFLPSLPFDPFEPDTFEPPDREDGGFELFDVSPDGPWVVVLVLLFLLLVLALILLTSRRDVRRRLYAWRHRHRAAG